MMNVFCKFHMVFLLLIFAEFESNAQSVGGTISGATSVCPNSPNSGFLQLLGYTGTILTWETSINGGVTWIPNSNPTASQNYFNLTQTTCYRVIVKNGAFPSDTSSVACITIIPPSVGGTITGGGTFCNLAGTDTLFLTGETGNVLEWQYSINSGSSWTTVANTTDTLIHPTITQNTIYRAIVRNGAACPKDTSSLATFIIDPVSVAGTISGSDSVCYLVNTGTLSLSGNVGSIVSWLSSIDNGISWTTISNITANQNFTGLTQTTLFAAIVQSGVCSKDTAFWIITVRTPPLVSAGIDTTITKGYSFTLNGFANGTVLWSPLAGLNNNTLLTPTATPSITTTYVLMVTDANGCTNIDSVLITVIAGEFSGIITNLITPNGDNINDTWYIQGIEVFPDNEVFIYNIYGNLVYNKMGYMNDWMGTYNGSDLPDGTYFYVVNFSDFPKVVKGSLDILRNK